MNDRLPLFYKNIAPLSKKQHSNVYVRPVEDYNHTRNTNSLYIAAVEFPHACHEYPIVFGKSADEKLFPVALLGLKKDQNMFVTDDGQWAADYIPAYVRRYPFILATANKDKSNYTVCIDEDYPGFNVDKEGQQLFDEKGNETEPLKQTIKFLQEYQNHIEATNLFCSKINYLDIVESMQAKVERNGEEYSLGGFFCVSREKLKALGAEQCKELLQSDYMELIFAHLNSLNNLNAMLKRIG